MNNLLRIAIVGVLLAFAVLMIGLGMARNTTDLLAPLHLLLFAVAVVLYILPTALAYYRNCTSVIWIALVNVFLGWTILGWFVAIGWAASGKVLTLPPTIGTPPGPEVSGHLPGHVH
jgi:RsiW-degrading membrane proteinase PrsW (M82 family)